MSGNKIGKLFTLTTAGESHGYGLIGIVDGCPPNMELSVNDIQCDLDRRKPGTSRHTSQRREDDKIQILSGIFADKTTGTPIALLIKNNDQKEKDYENIKNSFRPGHADYTYWHKYGIRDYRGGGRSSARETAIRVAAGAIAKKYLTKAYGIKIKGYLMQIGDIEIPFASLKEVDNNPFFAPNKTVIAKLESYMDNLRKSGDSIGAKIRIIASNMPVGLGEPIFDRLDADIAKYMMSINAVKGVEIGAGFACVSQKGSENRDAITKDSDNNDKFLSNNAGGILGGISSGQDIVVTIALKPTSSLRLPITSINLAGKEETLITTGRHDPCVGIRATPIAEAMLALLLLDHALRHKAQNK